MDMRKIAKMLAFPFLCGLMLVCATLLLVAISEKAPPLEEPKITGMHFENTIMIPGSKQRLPGPEGSLVLWTKPPVEILEQFSDVREYILFFASTNEPKITIAYNIQKKQFEVGTPLMSTPVLSIFDGVPHQLAYTYKEGENQAVYIDGVKVNESKFEPHEAPLVTGFVLAQDIAYDEADIADTSLTVVSEALSPEQLARIEP